MKGKAISGVKRFMAALTIALLFLVLTPKQAHAYIDAGTGGMIIQGLIGMAAAALAMAGIFWKRITIFAKTMFRRSGNDVNEEEDVATAGTKDKAE